jgi:alpha-tubulin suppressor-like RCC1 family protein
LGKGNTTNYNGAIQTPIFANAKEIITGYSHTFVLFNDGTVKSFGTNVTYGELGMGNITNYNGAIVTPSFSNVKQVSCGQSYTFLMHL